MKNVQRDAKKKKTLPSFYESTEAHTAWRTFGVLTLPLPLRCCKWDTVLDYSYILTNAFGQDKRSVGEIGGIVIERLQYSDK